MPKSVKVDQESTRANLEYVVLSNLDLIISELTFHLGVEYDKNHLFWRSDKAMREILAKIFDSMPMDFRISTNQAEFIDYWFHNKRVLAKKFFDEQLLDDLSERFAQNEQLGDIHY